MKYKACEILLRTITRCKKDEKILIVTDPKSLPVAMALWDDAAEFPNRSMVMMPMQTTHGQEPTALVRAAMMEADVIFRVTSFSISNTEARRAACANGARDVNCADYDMRMLSEGGLITDFEALVPLVNRTAERLRGSSIEIATQNGSHFTARIDGREPIAANALSWNPGDDLAAALDGFVAGGDGRNGDCACNRREEKDECLFHGIVGLIRDVFRVLSARFWRGSKLRFPTLRPLSRWRRSWRR